jgi:nicotinamide-nucleotide amidase
MNSIILSIGDELVLGQTVDTNSAWLSNQLAAVGCDITAHATVPDDQALIEQAIRAAIGRCDVLIVSGGIGPTEDDLTRQSLAKVMGVELEMNEVWLTKLTDMFKSRGREMPEINNVQAMIPKGAVMIDNAAGTAAGVHAVISAGDIDERSDTIVNISECHIFVMPGVPKEMKLMFATSVLPFIKERSGGAVILSRTLHTFGLGESSVGEKLGTLMKRSNNPSVGTTVANGIVSLRINARFDSLEKATQELEQVSAACEACLGDIVFGRDETTLPQVIAELIQQGEKKRTIVTAESCTGGLLAKMLTDLPGSSAYFTQGWVTYSNLSKYDRLGVPTDVINVYGAVSEPVVEAMAKNARRLAGATYALAISGIAGPDGGSPTKPVGTVCIALAVIDPANKMQSIVTKRTFQLFGDREAVRDRAAKMALMMLRFELLGKPMPF